jgi:hypothetical protein
MAQRLQAATRPPITLQNPHHKSLGANFKIIFLWTIAYERKHHAIGNCLGSNIGTWEIHWELMGTLWQHQNFQNKNSQTLFFK